MIVCIDRYDEVRKSIKFSGFGFSIKNGVVIGREHIHSAYSIACFPLRYPVPPYDDNNNKKNHNPPQPSSSSPHLFFPHLSVQTSLRHRPSHKRFHARSVRLLKSILGINSEEESLTSFVRFTSFLMV